MKPIALFCGYDQREAAGFHVFAASVIRRSSRPVKIIPLASMGLPPGSNCFTRSRFLVPAILGFKGHGIFVDASDMLCLSDVAELDSLFDPEYAVQVVKHPDYESQHARKYVGTEMECDQTNYSRKNWASCMIVNAEHRAWNGFTPEVISDKKALELLQFQNLLDAEIGEIPKEWNVLVDEGQDMTAAKILHWSSGIPTFRHYKNSRGSKDWFTEFETMTGAMQHG